MTSEHLCAHKHANIQRFHSLPLILSESRWSLTSQDVVLVVVVGLRPDFNEACQPVRGHELWNQVFIILQTEKTRLGGCSSRCYRDRAPAAEAVALQLVLILKSVVP